MAISIDQFVHHLADSSLMSADEVAALIDSLSADKKPHDAEQLAKELVRQKKLTAYQAQQVYAGKGSRWCWATTSFSTSWDRAGWGWCSRPNNGG